MKTVSEAMIAKMLETRTLDRYDGDKQQVGIFAESAKQTHG